MIDIENKPVLDCTCGSRMIWFNKENHLAVFTDIRELANEAIWSSTNGQSTRFCSVHPDVIADFRNLPFEDESFWHIVFDPPHLQSLGADSWMAKKYGVLADDWRDLIHDGFWECWRVLKNHGTLILKWSEGEIRASEVIKAIGLDPLYGCRSGKQSKTHWMAFIKEE